MKHFEIVKYAYAASSYGCTAELFRVVVFVESVGMWSANFRSLYGGEHQVAAALKDAGFVGRIRSATAYGKTTMKEIREGEKFGAIVSADEFVKELPRAIAEMGK